MNPAVVFEQERDSVWRAAYAITGVAQDADDVVQDTFIRLLNTQPSTERPLRPWLRTVAANLSRDRLRQRKRRAYRGPWLPSPVGIGNVPPGGRSLPADLPELPDARMLRAESVHFAWLLALEALTATQRTVLVLRDVLGCSTRETAAALNITDNVVKVTLHRARKTVTAEHSPPQDCDNTPIIGALLQALATADVDGIVALLHPQATFDSDSNGQVTAAGVPLMGAERIARVLVHIQQRGVLQSLDLTPLGSLSALAIATTSTIPNWPKRSVLVVDIRDGLIHHMWSQLNPAKLT